MIPRFFFALGLLLSAAAAAPQEFPRLRTVLPSGSVIFVENMPKATHFSVQLMASAAGARETPQTHGQRHLLEHLLIKGPDKVLRSDLEMQGLFGTADTYRDAMVFNIVGPPERLDRALDLVGEYLKPLKTTPEEIARETNVIREELALLTPAKRLSRELWQLAFDEQGLDPLGDLAVIAKSTPAELELLRKRHFAAQNLVISVSGPVDILAVTKRCRSMLPVEKDPVEPDRSVRKSDALEIYVNNNGQGRAVSTPGWSEPETVALLAAALALAFEHGRANVIYTPSTQPGLVLLLVEASDGNLAKWLSDLKPGQIDALCPRGHALAVDWIQSQLNSPQKNAFLRGILYSQSLSANPETFVDNLSRLDVVAFRSAVERFRKEVGK